MEKNKIMVTPSALESEFETAESKTTSKNKTDSPMVISNKMGISFFITSFSISNGIMTTAKPNIKSMFAMLLPITLPYNISVFPDRRELKEIANSGAEVPKATTVKPITAVGIFKFFANDDAPSTKKSAHFSKTANPKADSKIFKNKYPTPRAVRPTPFLLSDYKLTHIAGRTPLSRLTL
jgi:hypothetical protein